MCGSSTTISIIGLLLAVVAWQLTVCLLIGIILVNCSKKKKGPSSKKSTMKPAMKEKSASESKKKTPESEERQGTPETEERNADYVEMAGANEMKAQLAGGPEPPGPVAEVKEREELKEKEQKGEPMNIEEEKKLVALMKPRVFKRNAKQERIAKGKEVRGRGDYPTMDDILSDWDSVKDGKVEQDKSEGGESKAQTNLDDIDEKETSQMKVSGKEGSKMEIKESAKEKSKEEIKKSGKEGSKMEITKPGKEKSKDGTKKSGKEASKVSKVGGPHEESKAGEVRKEEETSKKLESDVDETASHVVIEKTQ